MKKAIKCGKLFDSEKGTVSENMLVVVDGKDIAEVVACPDVLPADCEVIDLSDSFVMPGLIDAHVHLSSTGTNADLTNSTHALVGDLALRAVVNARLDLEAGFTTVRDCGCSGLSTFRRARPLPRGSSPARAFTPRAAGFPPRAATATCTSTPTCRRRWQRPRSTAPLRPAVRRATTSSTGQTFSSAWPPAA